MKELEKTQRISIAAVLTILAVLIAVISYKKPKHLYDSNTKETLAKITNTTYFINQSDIDPSQQVLIDIRNQFDYDRGHLENALNMYTPEILSDANTDALEAIKNEGKTIVLYGNNPSETVTAFMLLTQLGFNQVKILSVTNSYYQNKLITKDTTLETAVADISGFIKESVEKTEAIMAKKSKSSFKTKPTSTVKTTTPTKVIPKKKKKKAPVEGGC